MNKIYKNSFRNSKLTVIIPFLNEGAEVYNTVESIRNTSNVNIILINDASYDNYDYQVISKKFQTEYIYHSERKGVAASRDEGVQYCKTEYFLLLDAHMRFYEENWDNMIIQLLESDDRVLLCCQTKVLSKKNEVISEKQTLSKYGAKIVFDTKRNVLFQEWLHEEKEPDSMVESIPCILGAAYAASKRYWTYLGGLAGLKTYGNDETYISLKVWLEGGTCKLIKNIVVGHLYRKEFPYRQVSSDIIYNKMLILEVLFPLHFKNKMFRKLRSIIPLTIYKKAFELFLGNKLFIDQLRNEFTGIAKNDFSYIRKINLYPPENIDYDLLDRIALRIILKVNFTFSNGLFNGKMGAILFLFHYAYKFNKCIYKDIAEELLDGMINNLHQNESINFSEGLSGIAWSIQYLIESGFVQGNINEILDDIDHKLMEWDPSRIKDLSFSSGLGGIVYYVLGRLNGNDNHPFDNMYLDTLVIGAERILESNVNDILSIEAALKFISFFKRQINLDPLSIYDLLDEIEMVENNISDYSISFKEGLSGIGLNELLK